MTYDSSGDSSQNSNERREVAREKSKTIRVQHKKKERRNRFILQGGILVVLVAIIAIVTLSIVNTIRPAGPGPLNMLSDGILIEKGLVAAPTAGLAPDAAPEPNVRDADSDVISIQVYVDYLCADCGAFSKANDEQITTWVNTGAATIEIHPIALLNSHSQGSQYSTRAANAAACVANYSADTFFAFNAALFADQPVEPSTGLTDEQLVDRAKTAGVTNAGAVQKCITDGEFESWVKDATDRALTEPIPGSDVKSLTNTPTIIVNGVKYPGAPSDSVSFAAFVVQAVGTNFNDSATATPTPVAPRPTLKPQK